MHWKGKFSVALLFIALLVIPAVSVSAATMTDIANQFICQCGCNMVLSNCTHAECSVRQEMLTLLKQKIEQGLTEEQIVQFFVAQYGEQVLASPPKRGFNLMAWVTPFAAILLGGTAIYFIIKRWVKQGATPQIPAPTESEANDDQYRRRLEKELKEFGERSFR